MWLAGIVRAATLWSICKVGKRTPENCVVKAGRFGDQRFSVLESRNGFGLKTVALTFSDYLDVSEIFYLSRIQVNLFEVLSGREHREPGFRSLDRADQSGCQSVPMAGR